MQLTLHRKSEVRSRQRNKESTIAKDVVSAASQELQCCVELASLKGASNWPTCRPLKVHGFSFSKAGFRDAIHVRYGWIPPPPILPSACVCGQAFSTVHALPCPIGGYPSFRHNKLRDITASLLSRVAHDVSVEPSLQPLSGERMRHRTAISEDGARLDVAARGCGVAVSRGRSLMSGYLTLLSTRTPLLPSAARSQSTRRRNGDTMKSVLEK